MNELRKAILVRYETLTAIQSQAAHKVAYHNARAQWVSADTAKFQLLRVEGRLTGLDWVLARMAEVNNETN